MVCVSGKRVREGNLLGMRVRQACSGRKLAPDACPASVSGKETCSVCVFGKCVWEGNLLGMRVRQACSGRKHVRQACSGRKLVWMRFGTGNTGRQVSRDIPVIPL